MLSLSESDKALQINKLENKIRLEKHHEVSGKSRVKKS